MYKQHCNMYIRKTSKSSSSTIQLYHTASQNFNSEYTQDWTVSFLSLSILLTMIPLTIELDVNKIRQKENHCVYVIRICS